MNKYSAHLVLGYIVEKFIGVQCPFRVHSTYSLHRGALPGVYKQAKTKELILEV